MDRLSRRSDMSTRSAQVRIPRAWLQYGGLLVVFVVVVGAGFLGFRIFATTPTLSSANLYLFAVVAGVASFFSPCAFPLLPSYFSFYQTAGRHTEEPQTGFHGFVCLQHSTQPGR